MNEMLDLFYELKRLVAVLADHKIDYALCGGLAMGVHGRTRSTIDIDLLILSESLDDVLALASALGYNIRGKDLSFAEGVIEIRRVSKVDAQDGDLLSLDLLLVTPEIRPVWESRIEGEWEGGKLSVVSPEGLIALKQLRRSGHDLDDIKELSGEGLQ
jgi:hypothetical protein